jgi:hypothetical protein
MHCVDVEIALHDFVVTAEPLQNGDFEAKDS